MTVWWKQKHNWENFSSRSFFVAAFTLESTFCSHYSCWYFSHI